MDCLVESLFVCPLIRTYIQEDTNVLNDIKDFSVPSKVTDMRVLEKYPDIKKIILDKFYAVADKAGYAKREYVITTSWITWTSNGDISQIHNHRNSFWSGVYYFQDEYPEGSATIQFFNPLEKLSDVVMMGSDLTERNPINSSGWEFNPEPKQLIFFPSYLEHQVMKHTIDKIRCSLAFNIMPMGKWGDGDSTFDTQWI